MCSSDLAAGLLCSLREDDGGPILYWATNSGVPAPVAALPPLAPRRLSRWVEATERALGALSDQP